jgi:hypothetical protein
MGNCEPATESKFSSIPSIALGLGWAGVLPFAGLSIMAIAAPSTTARMSGEALVGYAAIILGFMGGVEWGLEMARSDDVVRTSPGYLRSVVPALGAFAATLAPPVAALWLLAVGFAGVLSYDVWRIRRGVGPGWYASLRWQLSLPVIVCLLGSALAYTIRP